MTDQSGVITVHSDFPCGNGNLVAVSDDGVLDIEMVSDCNAAWHQWFYFEVRGAAGRTVSLRIINAGKAAFARGYEGYQACVLDGGELWRRTETNYDNGILRIDYAATTDVCRFAYFAPFTPNQHEGLIEGAKTIEGVRHEVVGQTVEGRDLDLLHINPKQLATARHIWLIARQHPGESMAEWWMKGLLDRLLARDPGDQAVSKLTEQAIFHIVPCMNPDGVARGHIRANAAGVDLNRAWKDPDPEKAPEVFAVRQAMAGTGVDFCLDVHGDEALPYVFLNGMTGIPSLTDHLKGLNDQFYQAYLKASPDFQIGKGYPPAKAGAANLAICANYIGETHHCLALTLEQPFKDNANLPDAEFGWSPARSEAIGAAFLDALAEIFGDLRA